VALTESLKELLLHSAELAKMSAAAKTYAVQHQGATKNILAALDQQINK
jgi:3-deoxy-D-manno-octulosonic-acid transferase